jgi:hypothetical protein
MSRSLDPGAVITSINRAPRAQMPSNEGDNFSSLEAYRELTFATVIKGQPLSRYGKDISRLTIALVSRLMNFYSRTDLKEASLLFAFHFELISRGIINRKVSLRLIG